VAKEMIKLRDRRRFAARQWLRQSMLSPEAGLHAAGLRIRHKALRPTKAKRPDAWRGGSSVHDPHPPLCP
jgi:hypothetical protein